MMFFFQHPVCLMKRFREKPNIFLFLRNISHSDFYTINEKLFNNKWNINKPTNRKKNSPSIFNTYLFFHYILPTVIQKHKKKTELKHTNAVKTSIYLYRNLVTLYIKKMSIIQ